MDGLLDGATIIGVNKKIPGNWVFFEIHKVVRSRMIALPGTVIGSKIFNQNRLKYKVDKEYHFSVASWDLGILVDPDGTVNQKVIDHYKCQDIYNWYITQKVI